MNHTEIICSFFIICAAYVIKGLAGFGDPLVYTPLLSGMFPNAIITPGIMPTSLLLNMRIVWRNRAHFSGKVVFPICFFLLLGIIPGIALLRYGSPQMLKLLLGLVIIGIGIEMLTRKENAKAKPNPAVRGIVSFFSGVTAGLFGVNLFFLAYMERVSCNREEFRSNTCFVFAVENALRGVIYWWSGMFVRESLMLTVISLPAALLGMKLGGIIDRRVGDRLSRKFIIYVFIAGGISTTIYALLSLIR